MMMCTHAASKRTNGIFPRQRPLLAACLVLGGLLLAGQDRTAVAAPATLYRVVNLGESFTDAHGINASGQVAFTDAPGIFDPRPVRAHFFDGRTIHTLGTLGGDLSVATGVNDAGEVTGRSTVADGRVHAFIWSRRAGLRDLGLLPGTTELRDPSINNRGEIAATASGDPLPYPRAVRWSRTGGIEDLGALAGGADAISYARAINDAGMIVGNSLTPSNDYHAFAWTRATGMVDIDTLGTHYSDPVGVSANGLVAGNFFVLPDNFTHVFAWTRATGMRDLGAGGGAGTWMTAMSRGGRVAGAIVAADFSQHALTWTPETGLEHLGTLGGSGSNANAANDRGQVVGAAATTGDAAYHAFVWTHREGMVDLNTRLLRAPAGLELYSGIAIADNGAIVADSNAGLVLLVPAGSGGWRHVAGPIASPDTVRTGAALDATVGFAAADETPQAGPYRVTWSWGDGSADQPGAASVRGNAGTASARHVYTLPGIYTVTATIVDASGRRATTGRRIVANDASGGAVGAGSFAAPAVAAGNRIVPGGRASFAFVARSAPQARGQLAFKLGNLDFRGTADGPAVVRGQQASLAGSGTLNGQGRYRFALTTAAGAGTAGASQPARVALRITHADPKTGAEIVDYESNRPLSEGAVTVRE
jgi:probable HAF family extracellular repeat protein